MQAIFNYPEPVQLESGYVLPQLQIAYCTYGTLNASRNNVIYVCHALTANADVADWWPHMVGDGLAFDTSKYFIVCANILGSCYGTTGPASVQPQSGKVYADKFPFITIRDVVHVHQLLAQYLQVQSIELLCGGSLGGQQAMEWAIEQPDFIQKLFLIATNARHSAWGIAFNEAQRMALQAGSLEAARAIAMLSYRNYRMYNHTQTDSDERVDDFNASAYQRYQGEKLNKRFDAHAYYTLSKAMDSHHVGRGRKSIAQALQQIQAKTLVVGISSDLLFPTEEQQLLASNIPNAALEIIDSHYGHDGFLTETQKITELLKKHQLI